jgi:hypothetical protein
VFASVERQADEIAYLVQTAPSVFAFVQPSLAGYHTDLHSVDVHQHVLHAVNMTATASNGTLTTWPFHDL